MTWQINESLSLLGNYAFTEAEFTDALAGVPDGNHLPGVPKHSGRFWANYAFHDPMLEGWSVAQESMRNQAPIWPKTIFTKATAFTQ